MTDSLTAGALSRFLGGRYEVEGELGRGGMATVFRARDVKHTRSVALKVVHAEVSASLTGERFLREIRIAAGLQHPHIVPLYDSGEAGPFLFYVMPLVQGESLRARLDREGVVPVDEAVRLTGEIADALAYAHRSHVVHRDIKPGNVLLSEGHALVADFGIATAVDSAGGENLTRTGATWGTPAYMSPEQVDAATVDGRSDIYSLGCVLYEMLAGRPPVEASTPMGVAVGHALGRIVPLQERRPDLPSPVVAVVHQAVSFQPGARFATADALRSALAGDGTQVVPAGPRPPGPAIDSSVAVLPFRDMSPDGAQQYFGDGIAEEIVNALARIDGLKVAARSSTFYLDTEEQHARAVGVRLGVRSVLEGSIRTAGDQVRITVQLVEAATGFQLWSDRYQRELSDIFTIQDEITEAIVHTVAPKLRSPESTEERTVALSPSALRAGGDAASVGVRTSSENPDPEAYKLYLQGRYHWYKRYKVGLQAAIDCFEQATRRDPGYAPPYAGLADAYHVLGVFGFAPPEMVRARAVPAIDKAIALDPSLAAGHFSRGGGLLFYDWDFAGAEAAFVRALELEPSHAEAMVWLALSAVMLGRREEGLEYAARAQDLEPDSPYVGTNAALAYAWAGERQAAADAEARVIELEPGLSTAHYMYGEAQAALGDLPGSVASMERATELSNRALTWLCALGATYGRAGRTDDAERVRVEVETRRETEYVTPTGLAMLRLHTGSVDEALELLEAGCSGHDPTFLVLALFPVFDPLRDDPRFQELLSRAGVPAG